MQASFGVNKLLITAPEDVAALYPHYVRNATFMGRLMSAERIVNVDIDLYYNDEVRVLET